MRAHTHTHTHLNTYPNKIELQYAVTKNGTWAEWSTITIVLYYPYTTAIGSNPTLT